MSINAVLQEMGIQNAEIKLTLTGQKSREIIQLVTRSRGVVPNQSSSTEAILHSSMPDIIISQGETYTINLTYLTGSDGSRLHKNHRNRLAKNGQFELYDAVMTISDKRNVDKIGSESFAFPDIEQLTYSMSEQAAGGGVAVSTVSFRAATQVDISWFEDVNIVDL